MAGIVGTVEGEYLVAGDRKFLIATPIKTANQETVVRRLGGYRRYIEHFLQLRWPMLVKNLQVDWGHPQGLVFAEVVRGSWRASCPFCRGAVYIEPSEPFFCVDCAMQGNGFKPMRVMMPDNREDIERLLRLRPNPNNRNWIPPETVEMLRAENAAHGVS